VVLFTFLKRLPFFALWVLAFLFGGWIYLGDRFAAWLLRHSHKTEYVLKGGCARTGQCCRSLALQYPRSWVRRTWLVRILKTWYAQVFNFHYLGTVNENWLVFECHYLKNGNTCGIYPYRPKLCREFPVTPRFGHGRLHKGCGFWFTKRSEAGTFQEAMDRQGHEQERREYFSEGQGTTP